MIRLAVEILVVAGVIYFGWDKPFHAWIPGNEPEQSAPAPAVQSAARSTQPAWMHDPNHRSVLDTPRPNGPAGQAANGSKGAWMFDPNHHATLDPPHKAATPH